jgi:hypothetical protein
MIEGIYRQIREATSLPEVQEGLVKVFTTVKEAKPQQRIGVVSGIISSEGDKRIERNMRRLHLYTAHLSEQYNFPIFSAVDVFGNGLYAQIEEFSFERELREKHFVDFWRGVFRSGHLTDVFMTPRWEISSGARDEHAISLEEQITIHYVQPVAEIEDGC